MTVIYWTLGVALVVVTGFFGWATTLPAETSASRTVRIETNMNKVFSLVTDIGNQSAWRSDVNRVEVTNDGTAWVEHTKQGQALSFRGERKEPGFYVISFTSPQGFSGEWEGRFVADGDSTTLEITETVRTNGLFGRAMARLFATAGAHIDLYLRDLTLAAEA